MAPIQTLPSPQFDNVKALTKGTQKSKQLVVRFPTLSITDQIIKTEQLFFEANSKLIIQNLNHTFIVIYADEWHFSGHFEIRRTSSINLNGDNGTPAPPPPQTLPGYGRNGNNGLPGLPGRDGQPGLHMPTVIIFGQASFFGPREATALDVDALFFFDGYPGGNGGDGGRGSNGTNGNRGEPAQNGSWGDCASGPGWGGRGGNAGPGGMPGYGANGGDAPPLYMFVQPDQVTIFRAITVSGNGGDVGVDGQRGQPGFPGRGGDEGEYSGNCGSVGRTGPNGKVPDPCPFPEISKTRGADGKAKLVDYVGFLELQ